MNGILHWVALLAAIITSSGLILSRDWRWMLGFLAAQYLAVFWLVMAHWTISMSAAILVTGWMACAVLGIARRSSASAEETASFLQGRLFKLFSIGMILVVTFTISQRITSWLNIDFPITWAGVALMGLGLLHLGITGNPLRVVISLLSILAGFQVLYAAVENSILVMALLAVVYLGLALAGAFFLVLGAEAEA